MSSEEDRRHGDMTTRQLVITFAVIEALVLVPLLIYLIWMR